MAIHKNLKKVVKRFAFNPIRDIGQILTGQPERKLAKDQFSAQMDQSIQRRVADAKKAGIHPLFALGSSPGASPTFIAGQSPIGSAAASVARTVVTKGASKVLGLGSQLQKAQLRAINASASRDEAAAIQTNSQTAMTAGRMASTNQNPFSIFSQGRSSGTVIPESMGVPTGAISPQAMEQISSKRGDKSTVSGKHSLFMDMAYGKDESGHTKTMKVIRSDEPTEAFENLGGVVLSILKNLGLLDDYVPAESIYKKRGMKIPRTSRSFRIRRRQR